MTRGGVVQAAEVQADQTETGAIVRTLLDTGAGNAGLVRRLVEVEAGRRFQGRSGPAGELWFVIDGSGSLLLAGREGPSLTRNRGLWLPPGETYELAADADVRLDIVTLPDPDNVAAGGTSPVGAMAADLYECEVEITGNREFRVLFGPGHGCARATQFVGEIPPGRAPDHSHPYDELVLILDGSGVAHIGGADHPLTPGSCLHLPPGLTHCLENNGTSLLRVLGVFHPADSPAAKLAEHA
jgi:quercetin dioxygenase-like cupin family protein